MRIESSLALLLLGNVALVGAQEKVCTQGPGVPFGITGYTCASCGTKRGENEATVYSFGTEPTVNAVASTSPFQPGDVITAMNRNPITTKEGTRDFATPRPGRHIVESRRWDGATLWEYTTHVIVSDQCRFVSAPEVHMRRIAAVARQSDRAAVAPAPLAADPTSRIGFAVSCTPSCTKITDKSGRVFWKHDGYPAVVSVRKGSPASDAGLQIGDLIAEVNGVSVTDEDGSRILQVYSTTALTSADCFKCEIPYLKMHVVRDGERRELTLHLMERRP